MLLLLITSILLIVFVLVVAWYLYFRILRYRYAVTRYEVSVDASSSALPETKTLTLASYNIAHGRGGDTNVTNWQKKSRSDLLKHLDAIANQIQTSGSDIVVLNEVDFSSVWSSHINQAEYIAKRAGYRYVTEQRNFDIAFPLIRFRFGNAILSRYPIEEATLIKFPPISQYENWFAGNHDGVMGVIKTPFGKINLVAAHLDYRCEEARMSSANLLNALSEQDADIPMIILGDLNESPIGYPNAKTTNDGMNAVTYLLNEARFKIASNIHHHQQYCTFPSQAPKLIIDWILGKGNILIVEGAVVPSQLSDHFMITARVSFG